MATLNLGRIKPVFRGAYSGSTAYVVDDIVTHGNESFICIQAHGAGTQATSVTAYWTKLAAKGTDGTDVGTTITTQGDILFRDGSGLQRLAKGTAAQTLKMNAGATAPEWATVTTPTSNWVNLANIGFAGESAWTVDNCFTSAYEFYVLKISNLVHSAHTQMTHIRFRTGGASGSDFTSSNYSVSSRHRYLNSGGDSYSANDHTANSETSFKLMNNGIGTSGYEHFSGSWEFYAPYESGKNFYGIGWSLCQENSGQYDTQTPSIMFMDNTSAFTGFKLYPTSGTMDSGHAILFGVKHS